MSAIDDLQREFEGASPETKKALAFLMLQAKGRAKNLKLQRKVIDRLARSVFKEHYLENNRRWDSKVNRAKFRKLMSQRHKFHERIARLVPEKVEPEWDSP